MKPGRYSMKYLTLILVIILTAYTTKPYTKELADIDCGKSLQVTLGNYDCQHIYRRVGK